MAHPAPPASFDSRTRTVTRWSCLQVQGQTGRPIQRSIPRTCGSGTAAVLHHLHGPRCQSQSAQLQPCKCHLNLPFHMISEECLYMMQGNLVEKGGD
jgi:hypothetical protein